MRCRGLTLIEVVVALALLAGAAATVLVAQARSLHQIRCNDERQHAYELVSAMMVQWQLDKEDLTSPDRGSMEGRWYWKREVRRIRESPGEEFSATPVEINHVQLHIWQEQASQQERDVLVLEWLAPLTEEQES